MKKTALRLLALVLVCVSLLSLCACSKNLYVSDQEQFTWQMYSTKYWSVKELNSTAGTMKWDSTRTTEDCHDAPPEGYTWIICFLKLTKQTPGLKKFYWDNLKLVTGDRENGGVEYGRLMTDYEFISNYNKYKPYATNDFVAGELTGYIIFEVKDEDAKGGLALVYTDETEGQNIIEYKK